MRWRGTAKSLVERALVVSGVPSLLRHRLRRRALVLAYHNIVPHGEIAEGDRSLHLSQRDFAAQLDNLRQTHEVVPLAFLLAERRAAKAGRERPFAAITFDDAYRGAVTAGLCELARRALPATIFVAPGFVGDRSFWWDVIAGEEGVGDATREHALAVLEGDDEAVRRWHAARGRKLHEPAPHARCASETELSAAAGVSGITFGAHSWSHPDLTRVDDARLAYELGAPIAWLRERFDNVLPVLAYPYGLTSPAVERAVPEAGYRAACGISGGWMASTPEPCFHLPRLNIPAGLSIEGFRVRSAGLFCS